MEVKIRLRLFVEIILIIIGLVIVTKNVFGI